MLAIRLCRSNLVQTRGRMAEASTGFTLGVTFTGRRGGYMGEVPLT